VDKLEDLAWASGHPTSRVDQPSLRSSLVEGGHSKKRETLKSAGLTCDGSILGNLEGKKCVSLEVNQ
jgi:hypothetical protein